MTRQLPALGISKQVYVSWERLQLISQVAWDAASLRDVEVTESQLREAYKGKFTGGTVSGIIGGCEIFNRVHAAKDWPKVKDMTKAYVDIVVDIAFADPADKDAITVEYRGHDSRTRRPPLPPQICAGAHGRRFAAAA